MAAVTVFAVDTPAGPAKVHLHTVEAPGGGLVLGHGAGGGVGASDLVTARDAALEEGFAVALVEQPYRVAGRRSPAPASRLDAAWTAVIERLRADELDAAFTAVDPDVLGEDFAASLIWEEEFVVALPVGHPLTRHDHVTLEQLAGEELVTYRENSALRLRLEKALAKGGLTPRNAFICTEMGAVRALVSKGLGVAVLPRSIADEPGPAITFRPVGPELLTWPVALVWRAGRRQPPAAKAFLQLALARAEEAAAKGPRRPPVQLVA
jgi:DNA-binding transcriptional LysR family regulator